MGLGSGGHLGHSMIIVFVLIVARSRSRLVSVSGLRLLWVELISRPIADLAILLPVTAVWIGTGLHWDIGGEGVGGFVEAIVAGSVDLLGLAIRRCNDEHVQLRGYGTRLDDHARRIGSRRLPA